MFSVLDFQACHNLRRAETSSTPDQSGPHHEGEISFPATKNCRRTSSQSRRRSIHRQVAFYDFISVTRFGETSTFWQHFNIFWKVVEASLKYITTF